MYCYGRIVFFSYLVILFLVSNIPHGRRHVGQVSLPDYLLYVLFSLCIEVA